MNVAFFLRMKRPVVPTNQREKERQTSHRVAGEQVAVVRSHSSSREQLDRRRYELPHGSKFRERASESDRFMEAITVNGHRMAGWWPSSWTIIRVTCLAFERGAGRSAAGMLTGAMKESRGRRPARTVIWRASPDDVHPVTPILGNYLRDDHVICSSRSGSSDRPTKRRAEFGTSSIRFGVRSESRPASACVPPSSPPSCVTSLIRRSISAGTYARAAAAEQRKAQSTRLELKTRTLIIRKFWRHRTPETLRKLYPSLPPCPPASRLSDDEDEETEGRSDELRCATSAATSWILHLGRCSSSDTAGSMRITSGNSHTNPLTGTRRPSVASPAISSTGSPRQTPVLHSPVLPHRHHSSVLTSFKGVFFLTLFASSFCLQKAYGIGWL
ncbi:unnamed protein product [Soboliphyme baturini]|uniref:Uncharacterized protein n=1 Tax=Soboliphyme baturini TaxID=241478 RepID=A0A183IW14_9BILA|nr:unnamed protein product [Soboliphyme baturini]